MSDATNATFHSFKQSGKWYATDRGLLTADVFAVFETSKRRARIVAANGGRYPGLNSAGVCLARC